MIHAGLVSAIFAFLLWSLPGAIGMYALSLGVQKMPDRLPPIVYALLSGMNASTVGIIALAAVQVGVILVRVTPAQTYTITACAKGYTGSSN